ncbi:hypothetical protein [Pseudomonas subflava]|uniref:hypothetical protein n=1 Tax=Pseudomonas subflava TaxID=2952933 RepID=UPI00207A672D|nr:hypothetical protein [Pseudomonas subflava]
MTGWVIRIAGAFGFSALLIGCSLPLKSPTSSDLAQAGRHREAAELNLEDASRSERQGFKSSAASYYVMAADNFRQSALPERELAALEAGHRVALQAWQQSEGVTDRRPLEGEALTAVEGRLAEYWLERDASKAARYYGAMLERRDDVRMLYAGPGLELVKAASRSEALKDRRQTMRLYLFGLSGQYVESAGDLYPQLATGFARRHGFEGEARLLRQRLARVKRLEADAAADLHAATVDQELRATETRRAHYARQGEYSLAAVYADQAARLERIEEKRPGVMRSPQQVAQVNRGIEQLAARLAAVGTRPSAPQPSAPEVAVQSGANPVNGCIQITSSGANTITLINNCDHNVSVAWCYIPAPGALQSEKMPVAGNQICIHNGTDFPRAVLGRSGTGADIAKTYRSWELPYSQNTIYHIACDAGEKGEALPQISGFDDNLRGSCPPIN